MAYTPINWQTGDVITADKLNKMDRGWSIESTQLFSETVTTADTGEGYATGQLVYVFQQKPPTEVVVTFDGTDYVCERDSDYSYGGSNDFSTYPFYISPSDSQTNIYTEAAGTHTVALGVRGVEVSASFSSAVNACMSNSILPMQCISHMTTYDDMLSAREAGRLLYFYSGSTMHIIVSFSKAESETAVQALPAGTENIETFGFVDIDGALVFRVFIY